MYENFENLIYTSWRTTRPHDNERGAHSVADAEWRFFFVGLKFAKQKSNGLNKKGRFHTAPEKKTKVIKY